MCSDRDFQSLAYVPAQDKLLRKYLRLMVRNNCISGKGELLKVENQTKSKAGKLEERQEGNLQNRLHAIRTRLGLSQRELAQAAGVARQTVGGIEAGLYAPSAAVALRLAKTLGCRVEDLFWLEDDFPTVPVVLAHAAEGEALRSEQEAAQRVMLAHVGGRWIAHTLTGEQAFRNELVPADGLAAIGAMESEASNQDITQSRITQTEITARLLDEPESLIRTVLLAGCAPALSLWARSAERWQPGLRAAWLHANSTIALERLARGEVHAAGVHLSALEGGQDNAPYVRQILGGRAVTLVNLGIWEEGLIVQAGNPKRLQTGADLAQSGVHLVNREIGAGSRLLLDGLLQSEHIDTQAVQGYENAVSSHQEVARAILAGRADVGVSAGSVAAAYGLGFVPMRQVRYDLAFLRETLDFAPVQQLLGTLRHRWILSQLRTLGGYDTTHAGEMVEV